MITHDIPNKVVLNECHPQETHQDLLDRFKSFQRLSSGQTLSLLHEVRLNQVLQGRLRSLSERALEQIPGPLKGVLNLGPIV